MGKRQHVHAEHWEWLLRERVESGSEIFFYVVRDSV